MVPDPPLTPSKMDVGTIVRWTCAGAYASDYFKYCDRLTIKDRINDKWFFLESTDYPNIMYILVWWNNISPKFDLEEGYEHTTIPDCLCSPDDDTIMTLFVCALPSTWHRLKNTILFGSTCPFMFPGQHVKHYPEKVHSGVFNNPDIVTLSYQYPHGYTPPKKEERKNKCVIL